MDHDKTVNKTPNIDPEDMESRRDKHDDEADDDKSGIKCKYMRAAHGYLSNTTFHGISWVAEDVNKVAKVGGDDNINDRDTRRFHIYRLSSCRISCSCSSPLSTQFYLR